MFHFFVMLLLSTLSLVVCGSPGFHWNPVHVKKLTGTHQAFCLWCHEAITSKSKCQWTIVSDHKWKWI